MTSRTANLLKDLAKEEQQNKEVLLLILLWSSAIAGTIGIAWIMLQPSLNGGKYPISNTQLALFIGCISINWVIIWASKSIPYAIKGALPIIMNIVLSFADFSSYGLVGEARLLLFNAVIFAAILFNWKVGAGISVIAIASHAIAGYLLQAGILVPSIIRLPGMNNIWLQSIYIFVSISIFTISLILVYLSNVLRILHQQQSLVNEVDRQRTSLEKIVAEKTSMLSITNEINRSLTGILDPNRLVNDVVQQLQHAFNYYHVHIYLLDETKNSLYIAAATGETGSALLLGKHRLPANKGIIGRAAQEKRPILVPNVSRHDEWIANPLLPETRSELAVPIMSGSDVLGILDVQHNTIDGLNEQDEQVLTNIALQTGIALRNAKIYETAQNKSQRESSLNRTVQKIQLAPDLQSTIQIVVEEVGKELKAPQTNAHVDLGSLKKVARSNRQKLS